MMIQVEIETTINSGPLKFQATVYAEVTGALIRSITLHGRPVTTTHSKDWVRSILLEALSRENLTMTVETARPHGEEYANK